MTKAKVNLIILGATLILFGGRAAPPVNAQPAAEPVVSATETGLTLRWHPPAYRVTSVTLEGVPYSQLQIPGLEPAGAPGQPDLPRYSGLIGLPPSGGAEVKIVTLETEMVTLPAPPLPAPQPVELEADERDPTQLLTGGPMQRLPAPMIYGTNDFFPAQVVTLSEPQQIRDQRVAGLRISPLRINPVTLEMEVVRYIEVEISFTEPAATLTGQSQRGEDGFNQALRAVLLNPAAASWSGASSPQGNGAIVTAQAAANETKVLVSGSGLYALTYTDLQQAGLPVGALDPRTFKLSHGYPRSEVAIVVEGQGDGVFNSGDRLLFYAEPTFSRYVDVDVYFLTYGGANGQRMATRSGAPAGSAGTAWRSSEAETNRYYDPLYAGRDGDRWFWDKLATPNSTSGGYALQVLSPHSGGPAATLTVWLQGYTASSSQNPDHKVQVSFNGNAVGTVTWDGKSAYVATLTLPSNLLRAGTNQVTLTLPGLAGVFAEGVWLDAMRLTYPSNQAGSGQLQFQGEAGPKTYTVSGWSGALKLYDITNPASPQQVTGFSLSNGVLSVGDAGSTPATYRVVPADKIKTPLVVQPAKSLPDPGGGADTIIITPVALAGAVEPLRSHRAAQGLRAVTVEAEAIYDAYGEGRMDPAAIRQFLAHAYQNWSPPAPLYVLLVGDGSYDFKNYSGFNAPTLLPPYLVQVDPWWGETAADNRLVTLVGNDTLPEMLIGRLPVTSAAETTTVVNKIIQYETNPPTGTWRRTVLFAADNPDGAGDFYHDADAGRAALAGSLQGQRFYLSEQAQSSAYFYPTAAALRADFLSAFNNGASLVTYHGHSSWHQWAVESLLHLDDVGQLANQNRLPVVLEMTCFTGFFHHPEYPTLDESLVRQASGGAIAAWAGTGLGVGTGHAKLQQGFYAAVMQQEQTILGAAVLAGKMELSATGYYQDLLDTYTLLGDPALRLAAVLQPDVAISQQLLAADPQPGEAVAFKIIVRNSGVGTAGGVQVTSLLPNTILSPQWSTAAAGVTVTGGKYRWSLPDLGPGETVEITISGTIDPALPPDFSILNTASVTSAGAELDTANNSSVLVIGGWRAYLPLVRR